MHEDFGAGRKLQRLDHEIRALCYQIKKATNTESMRKALKPVIDIYLQEYTALALKYHIESDLKKICLMYKKAIGESG